MANQFETLPLAHESEDRIRLLHALGTGKCLSFAQSRMLSREVQQGDYKLHADPVNDDWSDWVGSLEYKSQKMGSMRMHIEGTLVQLHHVEVNPSMADAAVPIFLCYFFCVLDEAGMKQIEVELPSSQYIGPLETLGFVVYGLKAQISMARLQKQCGW